MKKIVGLFLTLILILSVFPTAVLAADPEIIFGNEATVFVDADYVLIDGIKFEPISEFSSSAVIKVSGYETSKGAIYLNEKRVADLKNGENLISFKSSDLKPEANEIKIVLSAGNVEYNDNLVYGTFNADDITIDSFEFLGGIIENVKNLKYYMPVVDQAGTVVKEATYKNGIAVGDGWSASTNLGGTTPDVPLCVGFVFDMPSTNGMFVIDTTKLSDGEHTAQFFKGSDTPVLEKKYIVDNKAPEVKFSVANNANLSRLDKLTYTVSDTTEVKSELYLDGEKCKGINLRKLDIGKHTIIVTATDACGNVTNKALNFNLTDKRYSVSFNEKSVKMSVLGDADVYSATIIQDLRMFENQNGRFDQDYLRSEDEVLVSFVDKEEIVTKSVGDSLPYHSFVINTDGVKKEDIVVSYTGETGNGSGIVLKAWNYKENRWDTIAKGESGEDISVSVDVETYSYKKKMRINAMPDIVFNGSNTLVWNSDTQYYSRFEDLNRYYYAIADYTVEQYKNGNIGYYVHTGDLVDQTNVGDKTAHDEYKVASNAQAILDKANVPNGVVSGNHDIVHTDSNYSYYWKYFGEDRYKDFDWYGGSLNNNMHHYDLVSLGAYDFLFMYLGCYEETKDDTIAWANAVCEAYPNRNVVICTHEYLLPSGEYSSARSQVIWDEIIVPNKNVIMVLCGHNEGVCDQVKQVGDSDRYVLEILADYQFAELGAGPQHVLNGCTCDGEGYIRLMSFNDAGQVISTTYSPVASEYGVDPYNFYPSYSDSFVYDLDMIPANRSIRTIEFNATYNPKKLGAIGDDDISLKGCEAFYAIIENGDNDIITKTYVLREYEPDYKAEERAEMKAPEAEKIFAGGYSNVSENFRMNEKNEFPASDFVSVGVNLMPENKDALYQTSGTNLFEKSVSDNRAVTITHEKGNNATWITLANSVNTKVNVDEYNRIYFGVTADKNAKWNIYVNFAEKEINFSQNKDIAKLFGYVNSTPSDIQGTWNGYIDISDFVQGETTVRSIYLVSATPGQTVTFDYLFLGKSDGGKVKFITDDTTAIAYEAKIGDKIDIPGDPFKQGHDFIGWYTAKEGGEKIENSVTATGETVNLYARFSQRNTVENSVQTYNTEINLYRPAVGKLIFVVLSLMMMLIVVIVLLIKIKKGKKKV